MPRRGQGPRLRFYQKRGVYYIVWSERGRTRERSTGTADRERAEIRLADFLRIRNRGEGPRPPEELWVTDALSDYAQERGPKTASPERIRYALIPLIDFWEGKPVSEISAMTCEHYADWRQKSAGTTRRELGILRAALQHAFNNGRLTRPMPVSLPAKPEPKDRWLNRREAAALLRASLNEPKVRLYLPLFILMGLYTGQRKEAILSLRWPQVDLERGVIDFNPPGRRRTNKRRPIAKIAPRLMPHLLRARIRGSDIGYVFHIDGKRIKDVKKGFAAACQRARLDGVTPHTLRHTAATWLMQKGVSITAASGFLGMSRDTLERVYFHHHPDYQKEAAEAF